MRIYGFLKDKGKNSVTAIVHIAKLTQPTVSYHLKAMKDSGLLESERVGKEVFYSVKAMCSTEGDECILNEVTFKE